MGSPTNMAIISFPYPLYSPILLSTSTLLVLSPDLSLHNYGGMTESLHLFVYNITNNGSLHFNGKKMDNFTLAVFSNGNSRVLYGAKIFWTCLHHCIYINANISSLANLRAHMDLNYYSFFD